MLKKCKLDDEGRMLIGGIIDNQRIWTKKFVNKIKGTKANSKENAAKEKIIALAQQL
mgnify:CR=1 FL=1|jgi:hypothetical protein